MKGDKHKYNKETKIKCEKCDTLHCTGYKPYPISNGNNCFNQLIPFNRNCINKSNLGGSQHNKSYYPRLLIQFSKKKNMRSREDMSD